MHERIHYGQESTSPLRKEGKFDFEAYKKRNEEKEE
jgi:hypothetical protein